MECSKQKKIVYIWRNSFNEFSSLILYNVVISSEKQNEVVLISDSIVSFIIHPGRNCLKRTLLIVSDYFNFLHTIKFINGEHVTFSQLLKSYYDKASSLQINMNQSLDFMLNVCDKIKEVRSKFRSPLKEFMNVTTTNIILQEIPKNLQENYHDTLEGQIDLVRTRQKNLNILNKEILSEIECKTPSRYSKTFERSFNKWNATKITKVEIFEQIQRNKTRMAKTFEKLNGDINRDIMEADKARNGTEELIDLANLTCNKLLEPNELAAKKSLLGHLDILTKKIWDRQKNLFEAFNKVKTSLVACNKQRAEWAKSLIRIH